MGASMGAFAYELLLLLSVYPKLGGVEMLVHHIAALCSVMSGGLAQKCHYFIMLLLFTEVTNIPISMRWYLDKAGLRQSTAYKVNGLLMFLAWPPCRMYVFYPFYTNFALFWDDILTLNVVHVFYMFSVPPLLLTLNLFWYYKITRGVFRVFVRGKEAPRATREEM